MLADSFRDIGSSPYPNVIVRSGETFPDTDAVGFLFLHGTHGLCVFCHDSNWRKVAR